MNTVSGDSQGSDDTQGLDAPQGPGVSRNSADILGIVPNGAPQIPDSGVNSVVTGISDSDICPQVDQILNLQGFMQYLLSLNKPELAKHTGKQLVDYVDVIDRLNFGVFKNMLPEEAKKNLALLTLKCAHFFDTRDTRVDEINSDDCKEAREIKAGLYPFDVPNLILCLDGRVLSKLIAGLRGHAYRTPAGDSPEFKPGKDGQMFLDEGHFTHILDKAVEEKLTDPNRDPASPVVVVEIFDSHIACAAKGLEVKETTLSADADGGLYKDVLRKKEMVAALGRYAAVRYVDYPQVKVVGDQISFDIHDGFFYIGLEKQDSLNVAKGIGYTSEVMNGLARDGKIISTKDLAENSELTSLLQEYWFDLNYETRYASDTLIFFKNVKAMSGKALPFIEAKLISIYPEFALVEKKDELRQKAMLVLSNVYNGFLLNNTLGEDGVIKSKDYPYAYHDESLIGVVYSEKGPYDRARSFSNDPEDPNLERSISLQESIVRENRRKGMMSAYELKALFKLKMPRNPEEDDVAFDARVEGAVKRTRETALKSAAHHGDPVFDSDVAEIIDTYRRNPIPVMFFERLKYDPVEGSLNALNSIDWSDLAGIDWMKMSDDDFNNYVSAKVRNVSDNKSDLSNDVAVRINKLRHRAIDLYSKHGVPSTNAFLAGRLLPFWILADKDRKSITIIPFVEQGYSSPRVESFIV